MTRSENRFTIAETSWRKTYNEVAVELAAEMGRCRNGVKILDVVIEDDVDAAGNKVLLNPFAVFVRVEGVEESRAPVDDGNHLAGECVLDFTRIF